MENNLDTTATNVIQFLHVSGEHQNANAMANAMDVLQFLVGELYSYMQSKDFKLSMQENIISLKPSQS